MTVVGDLVLKVVADISSFKKDLESKLKSEKVSVSPGAVSETVAASGGKGFSATSMVKGGLILGAIYGVVKQLLMPAIQSSKAVSFILDFLKNTVGTAFDMLFFIILMGVQKLSNVSKILEVLKDTFMPIINESLSAIQTIFKSVYETVKKFWDWAGGNLTSLIVGTGKALGTVIDIMGTVFGILWDIWTISLAPLLVVFTKVWDFLMKVANPILDVISSVLHWIHGVIKDVRDFVWGMFDSLLKLLEFFGGGSSFVTTMQEKVAKAINEQLEKGNVNLSMLNQEQIDYLKAIGVNTELMAGQAVSRDEIYAAQLRGSRGFKLAQQLYGDEKALAMVQNLRDAGFNFQQIIESLAEWYNTTRSQLMADKYGVTASGDKLTITMDYWGNAYESITTGGWM